jgi:hypothetical protein
MYSRLSLYRTRLYRNTYISLVIPDSPQNLTGIICMRARIYIPEFSLYRIFFCPTHTNFLSPVYRECTVYLQRASRPTRNRRLLARIRGASKLLPSRSSTQIRSLVSNKRVCGLVVKSIVAMKMIQFISPYLDGPRVRFPANAFKFLVFYILKLNSSFIEFFF